MRQTTQKTRAATSVRNRVTFPIVDAEGKVVLQDRRQHDRRHWSQSPNFPFKSELGEVVPSNRRRTVDRRTHLTETVPAPDGLHLPKIILDTGEALFEITEDDGVLILGRNPECDVLVNREEVSNFHACVVREGERFVISDDSTNGTHVSVPGEADYILWHDEVELIGSGQIRLGKPLGGPHAFDTIRYTVIREL